MFRVFAKCPRCQGKMILPEICCECGTEVLDWAQVKPHEFKNLPCGHIADVKGGAWCTACNGLGYVEKWQQMPEVVLLRKDALPRLADALDEALAALNEENQARIQAVSTLLRALGNERSPRAGGWDRTSQSLMDSVLAQVGGITEVVPS